MDKQVKLTITTDLGFTADFLRELANRIEIGEDSPTYYENFNGLAEISWP